MNVLTLWLLLLKWFLLIGSVLLFILIIFYLLVKIIQVIYSCHQFKFIPKITISPDTLNLDMKKTSNVLEFAVEIKTQGLLRRLGDYPVVFWIEPPDEEKIKCELDDRSGLISKKRNRYRFFAVASPKPEKTKVRFKISQGNPKTPYHFKLHFNCHIHAAYPRVITIYFV
ncbi:MAG: hypothetical protein Ta2A_00080 [Treponemataceae bacterium]|nr:MAG: hypothetical protein Ta2A_00080 [Treponemataceae bacterium]